MYCGDHEHYEFLTEAFGLFAHQNALQRDMCPSATQFEGEIIAMALDLFHAGERRATPPGGAGHLRRHRRASPTRCSPTASTASDDAASRARTWSSPRRRTRRSTRRATCSASSCAARPSIPRPRCVRRRRGRRADRRPHGRDRRVRRQLRLRDDRSDRRARRARARPRASACTSTAASAGSCCRSAQELGYEIPPFDFRVPGVTSISADTHKYGYGLKGTSTLAVPRPVAAQPLLLLHAGLEWRQVLLARAWRDRAPTGCSPPPGPRWCRSAARATAATPRRIFETSAAMQAAVRSHPELRLLGEPTFLFAFTSDEFDIYHVNDYMKRRGWRFNGLQYPNALHMAVTRPQIQAGRRRALRRRPRRGGRLRATSTRDQPAESAADLRRGRRRPHRRGRRVHQARSWRQLLDAQQSVPAPA